MRPRRAERCPCSRAARPRWPRSGSRSGAGCGRVARGRAHHARPIAAGPDATAATVARAALRHEVTAMRVVPLPRVLHPALRLVLVQLVAVVVLLVLRVRQRVRRRGRRVVRVLPRVQHGRGGGVVRVVVLQRLRRAGKVGAGRCDVVRRVQCRAGSLRRTGTRTAGRRRPPGRLRVRRITESL